MCADCLTLLRLTVGGDAAELQAIFDLRYAADMRAIKLWQAAHPGNDLVWPDHADHADLVVWLLEDRDRRKQCDICSGWFEELADHRQYGHSGGRS